ncbi:hypothetical protein [Microbacterium dextranolyticum]|uniref:Lipoprotein n=1 Tax=Microbacterium dextranolyticum TaxID=36806 RepID=A0A9W6M628_9MICO|nr:hypothetical protein [Microbacterium dextranolyticum]MBM7464138.1 hypothetical protein [Microbacterium dextranolyticum]GLJ95133.1 hypothetical protein GCM10017591_11950 [Microbacterium dextranolyticum]
MIRRLLPLTAGVTAVALTLVLSACSPENAEPAGAASPTPSETASTAPSPTPSAVSPTPSPSPTTAACLVGTWTMGQEDLVGYYDDVNRLMSKSDGTFLPAGNATLTLNADGTFVWAPEIAVTGEVSGQTIVISFAGQVTGSYDQKRSSRGDRIWAPSQSTEALRVLATANSKPTDGGALSQQIGAVPIADARVSCTSDTLVLVSTFSDSIATSILHRG